MSEVIETGPRRAPAVDIAEILLVHVLALDDGFRRAQARSLRDIRRALRAQARCRATFKILLALRGGTGIAKKFADSNEGTIERPKTPCSDNALVKEPSGAPAPRRPARRALGRRRPWSPERRARQAEAIRAAMAEIDRAAHPGWQGPFGQERAQARAQKQTLYREPQRRSAHPAPLRRQHRRGQSIPPRGRAQTRAESRAFGTERASPSGKPSCPP